MTLRRPVNLVMGGLALGCAVAGLAGWAVQPGPGVGVAAGLALLACLMARLALEVSVLRPADALAARMRARLAGVAPDGAGPGGELAVLAEDLADRLSDADTRAEDAAARDRAGLALDVRRLADVVGAMPLAVIAAGEEHRIVLYDGRAAAALDASGPLAIGQSLFDHFDRDALERALQGMPSNGWQQPAACELPLTGGGRAQAFVHRRGESPGCVISFRPEGVRAAGGRVVHDFAPLPRPGALMATRLRDMPFVTLKTATTGPGPVRDHVLAIAARKQAASGADGMDLLVDPGCPIPEAASRLHGITGGMVHGAPGPDEAVRRLARFAGEAPIVGHNIAFDMAFLRRYARAGGIALGNPVIDLATVAGLAPRAGGTRLDQLAARFGIPVAPGDRHSPAGNARVAAEVWTAMVPLLESRGIVTFADLAGALGPQAGGVSPRDGYPS